MQSQRILVALKLYLLVALAAGLILSGGRAALAATITVNSTNDELNVDGDCSLREAIQAANTDAAVDTCTAGSGADTIELPAGTYTLTIPGIDEDANRSGDLDITESLAISGAGAPVTIIDANALDRVFHIFSGIDVTVSGVTIQNGLVLSPGSGGGLLNSGTLILSDSTVRGNSITGDQSLGGGLANVMTGIAELTNVAFTDNALTGVPLTVGGAISNQGTLLLTEGTISNNTSWIGGGIFNVGSLTVVNSTLHGNSAIRAGGAIGIAGPATLTNITVSGNTASFGGGFATTGGSVATITSSTFNANGASEGGGIYNDSAAVTLTGTIINNSTSGGNCGGPDPSMSAGHNLSSDMFCPFAAAGDIVNTDPLLGPLQGNSGSTLTHALLAGSPAIDSGSPDCPPPATDQRGVARPQGSACDIGAFEVAGVGGIAELPRLVGGQAEVAGGSSGPGTGVLAGVVAAVAAGAVALGGAAWYARRRWGR